MQQPPKTATSPTRTTSSTNSSARRIRVGGALAAGLVVAMFASAAPALAINPGGGRHKIEPSHQQLTTHAATKSRATSADDSYLDQELYKLRMCESHDNYRENTGNGYYGAYQFAMQTWEDLGMTGRPDQASPDEQDYAAKVLHARAGWGPWPACAAKEHLD